MDLSFTPEEQSFREEIRAWVGAHLPASISHKVHNASRLSREDMQTWAKILGQKGWLGYGWPKQFGGPGWNAIQKHLFEEECALAGAPRIVPFGPVMVAPVIWLLAMCNNNKDFCQVLPVEMCGGVRVIANPVRDLIWPLYKRAPNAWANNM